MSAKLNPFTGKIDFTGSGGGSIGGSGTANTLPWFSASNTLSSAPNVTLLSVAGPGSFLTFGAQSTFESDNDFSTSTSITYLNNGFVKFADDNLSGAIIGTMGAGPYGATSDSSGNVYLENQNGNGWIVSSSASTGQNVLQVGKITLAVPLPPTTATAVPVVGSAGGYLPYSGYTYTYRIYSYNRSGSDYVFSTTYTEASFSDSGSESGPFSIDVNWTNMSVTGYRILLYSTWNSYNFDHYVDIEGGSTPTEYFDVNSAASSGSTVTPNTPNDLFHVTSNGDCKVQRDVIIGRDGQIGRNFMVGGKLAVNRSSAASTPLHINDGNAPTYTGAQVTVNSPYGHQMQIGDGLAPSSLGSGYWIFDTGSDGGFGSVGFFSNNNQVATFVSKNSTQCVFQFGAAVSGLVGYLGIDSSGNYVLRGGASSPFAPVVVGGYGQYATFKAGDVSNNLAIDTNARSLYHTNGSTVAIGWTDRISKYNGISTVSNGVPSELGTADLTAQTAAKAATTLYTPTATGMFRITAYLQITTAASTSSVLGGATGIVITYNDGDGNVAQSDTMGLNTVAGAIAINSATNTTATNLSGSLIIYAKTGVAIQYAIGYTSVGGTAMQYAAHLKCEAL